MNRNPKPLQIAASLSTVVCAELFLLAGEGALAGERSRHGGNHKMSICGTDPASLHLPVFADVLFDQGFLRGYFFPMSTQQLTSEAMALPISERVSLAQALWQSIDAGLAAAKDREAIAEAIRRDEELSSGEVQGRTHEEVMRAARRAIGCA